MRKHILVIMIAILVLALATVAMAADPHVGTWKLNVAKSKINSGLPDKSAMVTITGQDNGIRLVSDSVDADGKAGHGEWAAKFDGKDYPFIGNADADTIAIKRINANTFSELFKKAGKEVFSARVVASQNAKTITRTVKVKNAKGEDVTSITIYDKQ